MSFTIQTGRIIADARAHGVSGRRTIGGYVLHFSVEISTFPMERATDFVVMTEWSAQVSAGQKGDALQMLASGHAESPLALRTYSHSSRTFIGMHLPLSPAQLAALEEERAGGELTFQLQISALATVAGGQLPANGSRSPAAGMPETYPVTDSVTLTVGLTDWANVLKQFEYRKLMVFAMDLAFGPVEEQFRSAHAMLERAQEHMLQGRHEEVVALSRKILESLSAALGEAEEIRAATHKYRGNQESREGMSKRERALFVQEAVRHYTHRAHHVDKEAGAAEFYSRSDATFSLALAAATFREAVARNS